MTGGGEQGDHPLDVDVVVDGGALNEVASVIGLIASAARLAALEVQFGEDGAVVADGQRGMPDVPRDRLRTGRSVAASGPTGAPGAPPVPDLFQGDHPEDSSQHESRTTQADLAPVSVVLGWRAKGRKWSRWGDEDHVRGLVRSLKSIRMSQLSV